MIKAILRFLLSLTIAIVIITIGLNTKIITIEQLTKITLFISNCLYIAYNYIVEVIKAIF